RERFMRRMGGGVAVLFSAPVRHRNGDVDFDYRQGSDFHYLTGFPEPDCVLVLAPDRQEGRFVLFVRPRDKEKEIWTGRRAGVDGAKALFGADQAFEVSKLDEELPKILENAPRLHYRVGVDRDQDESVFRAVRKVRDKLRLGVSCPPVIQDPHVDLADMRLFKAPEELALLRRACEISCDAHREAIRDVRPGMHEFTLQGILEGHFRKNGARRNGYPCIIGAGDNATVLHYNENDSQVREGSLVLVDAGAELDFYTADITRTFPANGKFSPAQRKVYQLCLDAQKAGLEAVRAGNHFLAPHEAALAVLVDGFLDLGLLKGPREEVLEKETYKAYFMHKTSHWLGMDVHDVGDYKVSGEWRRLEPGMVLTVEPGIYISQDCETAAPEFRGIGVRIEDDVLVTSSACEVLSSSVPKEIDELEALRPRR
ncbi:aminopeptidase P N-terminal domain-containing protein, partial [bacterium]|nr:aminopeptidase P N-terminal domain-containing protein [bacterium]